MDEYGLKIEQDGKVAFITIDRPSRKNAFNLNMWNDLNEIVRDLGLNMPRAIVLTGAGNVFSAGFDVNPDNPQVGELIQAVQARDEKPVEKMVRHFRDILDGFFALPVPIIAAINGLAFGGGAELAIRCDCRIADPDAEICFSEARLGLMPDWGGGVALTRLAGPAVSADLILTARKISASEALGMGIINKISKRGNCLAEALDMAKQIAGNGPRAVRQALHVIRAAADTDMRDALEMELKSAVSLIASGECIVGISAFIEKKTPEFPDPE